MTSRRFVARWAAAIGAAALVSGGAVAAGDGEPLKESSRDRLGSIRLTDRVKGGSLRGAAAPLRAMLIDRGKEDRAILAALDRPVDLHFRDVPLGDVLKAVRKATQGPNDRGIPIYVDPVGLQEAKVTIETLVSVDSKKGEPLKASLKRLLKSLDLAYTVKDGLLTITSEE